MAEFVELILQKPWVCGKASAAPTYIQVMIDIILKCISPTQFL